MDRADQSLLKPTKPRRRAGRIAYLCLLFIGGPYLLLCVMLGLIQRKLIYHPLRDSQIIVADAGLPDGALRDIALTADDGVVLNGWHFVSQKESTSPQRQLPARGASQGTPRPVVLYFAGNAAHRLYRVEECSALTCQGADVFLFDYRGYGDNTGKPSEEAIAADARAIWRYAVEERQFAPEQIVLYGESIGGGVAVRLAAEMCAAGTPPGGLITRSTFSSLTDAAAFHFPWLPVRWLLVERYPSDERIVSVTCPILMLHGDDDRIVPIGLGRTLFTVTPRTSADGVKNRFVELNGADHNHVLMTHETELRDAVRGFLTTSGLIR